MKRLLLATLLSLSATLAVQAQIVLLDNFNGGGVATGTVSGTSWVTAGNVVLNGPTITVGNTAKNDNGWGTISSASIDATGMNFLTIVAQRESGNAAASLVIAFEDDASQFQIFSVPTVSFATGVPTTVQIPISTWGTVNPANLTGWSIGGGTPPPGLVAFGMTFDNLSLNASAIPEPATTAMMAALIALGFVAWRRRASRSLR